MLYFITKIINCVKSCWLDFREYLFNSYMKSKIGILELLARFVEWRNANIAPKTVDNMGYNYGETKRKAMERMHKFTQQGLDAVFIYPGIMIGPYDHTLQLGRLFFDLKTGKLPGLIPGGGSYCHVTEVAKAHIAASKQSQAGEGYICAGDSHTNLSHAMMWQKMAAAIDVKPPKIIIPRMLFILYAYMCQFSSEFTKKPPQIDPGQARYMTCHQYASSNRAVKELGYHIPDIDTCIEDALTWYRDNGYDI